MRLEVHSFLAHPGQRFPVHLVREGKGGNDDHLRTVDEILLIGAAFAQLGTLYLETAIEARISQPCRRCLAPMTTSIELQESFEMPIPPGAEYVDLWPFVVRLVLSTHDPNVLCREDCRGLCPTCGTDLNRNPDHVCQKLEEEQRRLRDILSWNQEP